MKPYISRILRNCLVVLAAVMSIAQVGATPAEVSTPRAAIPPNIITTSNRPMMLLAASKDHTLFNPIYTDFEDVDGDGKLDTTFLPTFKYYGYFDAVKCYGYTNSRFEPQALALVEKITTAGVTTTRYYCSSSNSHWSGNFLNWASMTRLDVVRKMLYGGKRSTDTNGTTVLERAKLNFDAHSFVKYYRGTDIRDYTPYTVASLTKSTGKNKDVYAGVSICNLGTSEDSSSNTPIMRVVKGNYRLWATVEAVVCQWDQAVFTDKLARYYKDTDKGGGGINHETAAPNQAIDGATYGSVGAELNVRVKVCDPSALPDGKTLIGDERCQAFPANSTTNLKPYGILQEFGYSTAGGAARAEFGVITGSYDKNLTAGALRKNMGDFADEINATTGVFCHSASSGCAATLADGRATGNGAIKAFDSIILYGRGGGNYGNAGTLPASLGDGSLPAWGNPMGEMVIQALQYYAGVTSTNPSSSSTDTSIGLPTVTWQDPLSNSNATRKALYGNSICRPMYNLALSSSALSFDAQGATAFNSLPNRALGSLSSYTDAIGASTAENIASQPKSVGGTAGGFGESCSLKTVGTLSDVTGVCPDAPAMGGSYQVAGAAWFGNTSKIRTVTTPPSDLAEVKDALKVKTLAASLSGGSARVEVAIPKANSTDPTKLVYITPESLWDGPMPGAVLTFASISSSDTATDKHGAFMVTWNDTLLGGDYDMDITGFLRYDLVANASSPSGWDVRITTDIPNVCSGKGGTHGFSVIGVSSDTDANPNKRYLTHQHYNSGKIGSLSGKEGYLCGDDAYRARINGVASLGKFEGTVCNVTNTGFCSVQDKDFPVTMTFHMVGAGAVKVEEPLFYAAKYGSFNSSPKNADGRTYGNTTALPLTKDTWDQTDVNGNLGADDIPDGYFLARRPDLLEAQLRKALDSLVKTSNSAPAASSRQLSTNGFKYIAKFDSTTVSGTIEAFKVEDSGIFKTTSEWEAGQLLKALAASTPLAPGNARSIITNYGNSKTGFSAGVPFRWASLPTEYVTQMTTASTNVLSTDNATVVLNYLRGDQSKEKASTGLRERGQNLLGPIVNATPWVQSPPAANYAEAAFPGYTAHVQAKKDRINLLWASTNDGMLHAFNGATGAEVFAYVPGALANRLAEIPLQRGTPGRTRLDSANFTQNTTESQPEGTVWPYVDGSPFTGDVKLSSGDWKTYAFSSLGRGGRAIFALDATDVSTLTSAESGSNANSVFRWQFTSDDSADLGYQVNDIAINVNSGQANPIVKLNNGKFALMVGNGYKSASGKAVLFILYVDGPDPATGSWNGKFDTIVADAGTGNGLSPPTWIDLDNNGTADVVYAGDLKGNLWKFDLAGASPTAWAVAYKVNGVNKPLFTAKEGATGTGAALPITAAPEFAYPSFDGLIITFGTGYAFETGDFPKVGSTQRMYGIWDRPAFSATTSARTLPTNLTTLVPRTYTRQTDGTVQVTDAQAIDWLNKDGWYFSMPGSSEMVLSDPELSAGVLTFTAVRPKTSLDNCNNTPNVTLYTIDPISGKSERNSQGETTIGTTKYLNAGTEITDQKVVVVNDRTKRSTTKQTCQSGDPGCTCTTTGGVTICKKDSACSDGQNARLVVGQSTDRTLCFSPNSRVQWREIPGLRTDR